VLQIYDFRKKYMLVIIKDYRTAGAVYMLQLSHVKSEEHTDTAITKTDQSISTIRFPSSA